MVSEGTRRCPKCGRRVRVGVPAGGDGSLIVFYRHPNAAAELCRWSRAPAPNDDDDEDAPPP